MGKSTKKKKSSLELGIFKKLKEEERFLEWIIAEYVVSVNSKYFSYDFPSSQLTKLALKILNKPKTKFSIMHRMVKEILKKWEKQGICQFLTASKYSHCRGKTKEIYRFNDIGFKKIKELIIDMIINSIKSEDTILFRISDQQTMKTREKMLDDILLEYEDKIELIVSAGDFKEDEDD